MNTEEAFKKINMLKGKSIDSIDLINKGNDGQRVMTAIGLANDSRPLDFDDGDLKTNKHLKGKPSETLFISQIKKRIGEFENGLKFHDSWIYAKIKRFVYLPIHKDNSPNHVIGIPQLISEEIYPDLYKKIEEDFNYVSLNIQNCIQNKEALHTTTGPNNFLQIRSKDSKKKDGTYNAIVFNEHQLYSKNMAFYFTIPFLKELKKLL